MYHNTNSLNEQFVNILGNSSQNSVYLFGYGSLMWKVDFEFGKKYFGYVENYQRQFWLLSDDHRGTPEK